MADDIEEIRYNVAASCRILGMQGLVRDITGHVSARIPGTDEMFIRCRGGDELGLMFTGVHNIRRTDFDGEGPGVGSEHASPNETSIHGEIYRARPDVMAVVHAHPYYALMCGIGGLEYRPVFGGYDPSSLSIALAGVPIYPKAATITNKELAADLLKVLGDRDVVLMRGHGITITGNSVEQATTAAIRFDRLSQIMWEIQMSGLNVPNLDADDMARYDRSNRRSDAPQTGWRSRIQGFENWGWKHYMKQLEVLGVGLPDDRGAD